MFMEACRPPTPTADTPAVEPFADTLARSGVELRRGEATTLQVNVGLLCNQSCRHCHLNAGPGRAEVMSRTTMDAVEGFARRGGFSAIDVTGGAPELVPGIEGFLARLVPLVPRLLFRANLTALAGRADLVEVLARLRVVIVASFPSLSASQTDAQRGAASSKRASGRSGHSTPQGTGVKAPGWSSISSPTLPEPSSLRGRLRRRPGFTANWPGHGGSRSTIYTPLPMRPWGASGPGSRRRAIWRGICGSSPRPSTPAPSAG
jgi:hypothetical protein